MDAHKTVIESVDLYDLLRSKVECEEFVGYLSEQMGISKDAILSTYADLVQADREAKFEAERSQAIVFAKRSLDSGNIDHALDTLSKFNFRTAVRELPRFRKMDLDRARRELKLMGDPIVTGFPSLDREVQIFRGTLTAIGGRPGEGKTSFALALAHNIAKENVDYHVLYLSTEMQEGLLAARLVAQRLDLSQSGAKAMIINPEIGQAEAMAEIEELAPSILCDENIEVTTICSAVAAYADANKDCHLVVIVDYLTNVHSAEKAERRDIEVGRVIQTLRKLASMKNAALIVLAQLNRDSVGKNAGNSKGSAGFVAVPALHHFRESGVIEAEASVALAVWNPDPKQHRRHGFPVKIRIKCLKNRYGASSQEIDILMTNPGGLIYESQEPANSMDDLF